MGNSFPWGLVGCWGFCSHRSLQAYFAQKPSTAYTGDGDMVLNLWVTCDTDPNKEKLKQKTNAGKNANFSGRATKTLKEYHLERKGAGTNVKLPYWGMVVDEQQVLALKKASVRTQ